MKVLTLLNGTIQLVLVPETDLEKEVVKQLNGASATLVSDNNNILNHNVGGGLLIKTEKQN
jgi:hypothetical protein